MSIEDGMQGIRGTASRTLGLAGLLIAAALVQGCGGSSGSFIDVAWSLEEAGAPVSCAAGDVVDIRVDTDSMTQRFACGAGGGTTPAVTCGVNHRVSLQLSDRNGTLLSSVPEMSLFVPCGGPTPIDVVFDLGGPSCGPGAISTTWVLTENGAPVECAPGDEVDLRIDTDAMTATFPCGDKHGTSPAITGGVSHNVSLKLFDKNGVLLSQTSVMSLTVPCGTTQPTPLVTFSLTP